MIANIVFDIGGVLLEFKPGQYLAEKFIDPAICKRLYARIFDSDLWAELDRGTITINEARALIHLRYPDLHKEVDIVLTDWESMLLPIEGSISILKELKLIGFNLYALSNFHLAAFKQVFQRYDFFQLFNGMVISANINYIKPEPEIYLHLLKKYSLVAKESIFIDDREDNLLTAKIMGFKTIQFVEPVQLRGSLMALNVLKPFP